jgi:hypothetical protein
MAVVTRQKSTARRLVSICGVLAVLEDTYQMVVNSDATVTLRLADTGGLTDTPVIVA